MIVTERGRHAGGYFRGLNVCGVIVAIPNPGTWCASTATQEADDLRKGQRVCENPVASATGFGSSDGTTIVAGCPVILNRNLDGRDLPSPG